MVGFCFGGLIKKPENTLEKSNEQNLIHFPYVLADGQNSIGG